MKPIPVEGHTTLDWVKPKSFRRTFELRSTEGLVGTLKFVQNDYQLAIAETANGVWLFRETRYVIPRISIWTQNQKYVAAFEGSRSGNGSLEFLDGRKYHWNYKDTMQTDWVFFDTAGKEILCFMPSFGRGKVRGKLQVNPRAVEIQDLSILCLLGWNIVIFFDEQESVFFMTR